VMSPMLRIGIDALAEAKRRRRLLRSGSGFGVKFE
jgi:hypothetical protein